MSKRVDRFTNDHMPPELAKAIRQRAEQQKSSPPPPQKQGEREKPEQ